MPRKKYDEKEKIAGKPNSEPVIVNTNIAGPVYVRLAKMRKAKGCMHDQELIRLFISEGLERAGF